ATQLKTEGRKNAQQIIQGLGHKLKQTTSELQNTCKKLYQSQKRVLNLQEILERKSNSSSDEVDDEENSYNSDDELQDFQEIIQFLISKENLGSSLFISTELFLTYILNQKCSTCQNENINEKKYNIKVSGLSIKIIITCCRCQVKTFYGNEIPGIEFSNLVAAAGLAGSINHEEWSMMLCLCGVTCQSGKSQYFQKQEKFFDGIKAAAEESANNALCIVCEEIISKKNEILEVGFDCAWSKVREAPQASAKFIYDGTPKGFRHKPIVAFSVVEKPRIYTKNEKKVIINEGNYNESSRQMEHANLINIISKVTPTLYKYNLTLDISVDGDLSTNKTLNNDSYLMQSKVCVNHLSDNHNNFWAEICWKVENSEIHLADPNLIGYSQSSVNALKEFLKRYTKLLQKQSLITTIRTSMNESFNHVKLNYTDKKVDYAKSFLARHGLAVLHNNSGLLEMLEVIRQAGNSSEFSEQNALRAKKITETQKQMEEFDYSKDLIPYGITITENIVNEEFQPSFANLIPDFDGFVICEASYIVNPKFYNSNEKQKAVLPTELIDSARESIESFLKGQETLTILPTGAGKTLIFSAASILTNTLVVVFTPLKAIMENQLSKLVKMGIPAATIYAFSDQPLEVQEKIFGKVAAGITKVLWITPEKFIESLRFRRFLHNVFQTQSINRPAWTKLGQIKEEFPLSSILLLTATCSYESVSKLKSILKTLDLKVLRNSLIYKPQLTFRTIPKPLKKKDIIEAIYKILEQCLEGRAIVYSSTPNEYQKTTLRLWHNQELKYIIATNAFGMGVHMPGVRIIIHATFPLSPTNFIQEIGRAGRDGQPCKSIVFYICTDIRELLMIVSKKIESANEPNTDAESNPSEMQAMAEDTKIPECSICDNCKRCIADRIVWYNISEDLLRILDTVDQLVEFANDPTTQLIKFGRHDIVDVFMKANNKNTKEKNLISLWENESDNMKNKTEETFIRTRSMCLHAIDRLCVEELLIQIVEIKPIRLGSSIMIYSSIISGVAPGARQKITENLWLEA
ncbi:16027_t:CDS:10, partial [Gigaspora rosea]